MIKSAIRKGVVEMKHFPVLCGSALKNKGVQLLLDAITYYLPSPLDVPPMMGTNPETGEQEPRVPDDSAPSSALAFKIMTDLT